MIFYPQGLVKEKGSFFFKGDVCARAHASLCKPIFKELFKNFSYQSASLSTVEEESLVFAMGEAPTPSLDGSDYALSVTEQGLCVCGKDEKSLIRGFMTLIDRFVSAERENALGVAVDCFSLAESPLVSTRMVHFCIFPETELWELQRFLRLSAALKYTHVVLEFWGMLKYD